MDMTRESFPFCRAGAAAVPQCCSIVRHCLLLCIADVVNGEKRHTAAIVAITVCGSGGPFRSGRGLSL
jgi:hypothetical protein